MKLFGFVLTVLIISVTVIFKVYDSDSNGKVTFNDILEVLTDLTGSFMSDKQREVLFPLIFFFSPLLMHISPHKFCMNLAAPEVRTFAYQEKTNGLKKAWFLVQPILG